MTNPDLNLLLTLEAVLSEGSVARAAQRLHLSPSAMSRALARLREATGDPLLVRAGRGLVPTPRAAELREQVGTLVHAAQAMLRPADALDLATLTRSFTLRVREGFLENVGAPLIARAAREAPGVRLCFVQKTDKESTALRDGRVDLDMGVVGKQSGPEVRTRALFRDRFVAVVRPGHPLCEGTLTPLRYVRASHIGVSRRGVPGGPVDDALVPLGLTRELAAIVGSFAGALALAAESDLVATVPARQTGKLRAGLHSIALPFSVPELTDSLLWHPRMDADLAHRWLRGLVLEVCAGAGTETLALEDF
jgi:DNA-binding transcriptional LysR family regulator